MCGPENMIENSKEVLEKSQLPRKKVLFELFYSKPVTKSGENGDGSTAKIIYDEEILELDCS